MAAEIIKKGSTTPSVICLYGQLGMGKTTFVQGFAKGLGITTRLLSPTFIIVRRQKCTALDRFFYHLDVYRMNGKKALEELGIREIFENPDNISVVEWAERLEDLLPKRRIDVRFEPGGSESERRIHITYVT